MLELNSETCPWTSLDSCFWFAYILDTRTIGAVLTYNPPSMMIEIVSSPLPTRDTLFTELGERQSTSASMYLFPWSMVHWQELLCRQANAGGSCILSLLLVQRSRSNNQKSIVGSLKTYSTEDSKSSKWLTNQWNSVVIISDNYHCELLKIDWRVGPKLCVLLFWLAHNQAYSLSSACIGYFRCVGHIDPTNVSMSIDDRKHFGSAACYRFERGCIYNFTVSL